MALKIQGVVEDGQAGYGHFYLFHNVAISLCPVMYFFSIEKFNAGVISAVDVAFQNRGGFQLLVDPAVYAWHGRELMGCKSPIREFC
jgi:hypothetical protein